MKKFLLLTGIVLVATTGCVNTALLKSSQAYYDSTEPYMKMAMEDKFISKEEVESIKTNMEQFKKTLDSFSAQKAWYDF